jgi:Rps23 Pro-64 3,4-dihydroxylase Tpa1-like proline 4-hydroxylase
MNNQDIELAYPTEVIGGCISIYRNAWSNVEETIDILNQYSDNPNSKHPFIPAPTSSDKSSYTRTNYHLSLWHAAEDNDKMKKITDDYYKLILESSLGYREHFKINEQVFINEGFNVLKYETGQEYKQHYDSGSSSGRTISPILYLNDDYEGGEIEFVNFGIKIKPEKGMLIVFPSTYPYAHIAHPVTSGTKYAIVTWLHDREIDFLSSGW